MARPTLRFEKRRARSTKEVGFFPADQWALERLYTDVADGKIVGLAITDPARSGKAGLYFAGLRVLFENQEEFSTPEKLRKQMLKDCGFSTELYRIDGTVDRVIADSMSEEGMNDEELTLFMEAARVWTIKKFDMDPWSLWVEQQEARKQR